MSFENLRVYQAARRLELGVNELTARYRGQFLDQVRDMRRAAASVPANIAEAHGVNREGHGRMVLHLEVARGSADETRSWLNQLTTAHVFNESETRPLMILARTIAKMLTGLIKHLNNNPDRLTEPSAASPEAPRIHDPP